MSVAPTPFSTVRDGVRTVADRLGDPAASAVVFLHGGGQTRRSWGRAAEGDYRVTTFASDILGILADLPPRPVLVGASLGGFTSMLLAGEQAPGAVRAVVLVDIVPDMDPSGRLASTNSCRSG